MADAPFFWHFSNRFAAQDIAGFFVGQAGYASVDEIGARAQQRVRGSTFFDPPFSTARDPSVRKGIIGDHFHAQAEGAAGDDRADIARGRPDQSHNGLSWSVSTSPYERRPLCGHEARTWVLGTVRQSGICRASANISGDGVFGGGDRIAVNGGVHSPPRPCRWIGDVDVINPNPGTGR